MVVIQFLGGGFKDFSFSPQNLGEVRSNFTRAYFSDGVMKNHQADLVVVQDHVFFLTGLNLVKLLLFFLNRLRSRSQREAARE